MKLIVFSLLVAFAMAVPAPGPEATPEAEADPAVLATYSSAPYAHYGLGLYGLHYPVYHYPHHYYGYPYYHVVAKAKEKRSAQPEPLGPAPLARHQRPIYRHRREAEADSLPEAESSPEAGPEAEADPEAWYYLHYGHYGYGYGYPYHYGYYGYPYGRYWYGK